MGFRDQVKQQMAEQERLKTPAPGGAQFEYDTAVNKGSTNMKAFAAVLNERARAGWRLHTAFEQDGNTVTIFERPVTEQP